MVPIARSARSWRNIIPVALGMLLGAALVAPAIAAVTPKVAHSLAITTQSRAASCAGLEFYPRDSDTDYGLEGGWIRARTSQAGSGVFLCDPGLPNRAVVTKVQFELVDNLDNAEVRGCGLWRGNLTNVSLPDGFVAMATVPSTGLVATTSSIRLTDSTIKDPTIDNTKFGYWLQCQINLTAPFDSTNSMGIIGADVIYTISSTNG